MMRNLTGYVYVMRIVGEPLLCKVGRTTRTVAERFGKNPTYHGYSLELFGDHKFEDCVRAEEEIHALLSWCRVDRKELFSIEPMGALGAVLWYAGADIQEKAPPRRELRLFRSRIQHFESCRKHGVYAGIAP